MVGKQNMCVYDVGVKMSSQIFGSSAAGQRTSTTWYLPYKDATELSDVASKLTGLPSSRFEEPQVVRYEMGEQFTWHYDAISAIAYEPKSDFEPHEFSFEHVLRARL